MSTRPLFVRPLTDAECEALEAALRSPDAFVLRRAQILLASARGEPVSSIAALVDFSGQAVRQILHAFNREGLAALLIWDNGSWHESQIVRCWVRDYNRQVKQTGQAVRLLVSFLPVKNPWLNPIEPKWLHGKCRVA